MPKIYLQRSSVAAGDDVNAPHNDVIFVADCSIASIALGIIDDHYLAKIAGGKATWVLRLKEHGIPLALIAQQWEHPRYLVAESDVLRPDQCAGKVRVFVQYHCQADPELVFDKLRAGEPFEDLYG